jgi:hypothetical protein
MEHGAWAPNLITNKKNVISCYQFRFLDQLKRKVFWFRGTLHFLCLRLPLAATAVAVRRFLMLKGKGGQGRNGWILTSGCTVLPDLNSAVRQSHVQDGTMESGPMQCNANTNEKK